MIITLYNRKLQCKRIRNSEKREETAKKGYVMFVTIHQVFFFLVSKYVEGREMGSCGTLNFHTTSSSTVLSAFAFSGVAGAPLGHCTPLWVA